MRLAERKAYLRTDGYTEKEQDKAQAAGEHWMYLSSIYIYILHWMKFGREIYKCSIYIYICIDIDR